MNIRPLGNKRGFGRSCDEIWALVLPRTDLQSTEDSLRPEGKQAMRIDRSEFGSITVDGKTYDHDVMIGLSGRVSSVLGMGTGVHHGGTEAQRKASEISLRGTRGALVTAFPSDIAPLAAVRNAGSRTRWRQTQEGRD